MNYDSYKQKIQAETERLNALWKQFKKDYPTTFGKTERISFDLPQGWVETVKTFAQKFEEIHPHIPIAQIKQKFGTLRIYPDREVFTRLTETVRADVMACIADVEEKALEVCEVCGTNNNVSRN